MAMIAQVLTIQNVCSSLEITTTPRVPDHVSKMLVSDDLTPDQRLRAQTMLAHFISVS